jgi:hypothetical protein
MSFGRRSNGERTFGVIGDSSQSLIWLVAAVAVMVVAGTGLALSLNREADPKVTLEQAALTLGVTNEVRLKLRQDFQKALLDMERDLCEETLRDKAGKVAVRYYETLLEKPVIAAGLEVTYHNRCRPRPDANSHPFERIIAGHGLGSNLTLPWDCLPDHWRSPIDRALQARLERVISVGHLTNDSLTGTLALVARSTKLSPIRSICHRPSHESSRQPNLPLISEPTDDWDRRGRRRRW